VGDIRGLTIKFANSPPCACRGSSEEKTQYGLSTLAYQSFKAMLLLIYGSLFLSCVYYCLSVFWGLASRQCSCTHGIICERVLDSKQVIVLQHPPCSPDLFANESFLFPKVKEISERRYFNDINDITSNMTAGLKVIPQNQFQNCFEGWTRR
jgi:hypothetical protein